MTQFIWVTYSLGLAPNLAPSLEVHGGVDSSILKNIENIKITPRIIELSKEIEHLAPTLEEAALNNIAITSLSNEILKEIKNINKEKKNGSYKEKRFNNR